jgi:pilus assembly protein FimV
MTDSTDNTKGLDSYGVWVKRPVENTDTSPRKTTAQFEDFNLDADLPDFSTLDDNLSSDPDAGPDDTMLTSDELLNITEETENIPQSPSQPVSGTDSDVPVLSESIPEAQEEKEISLDDFMNEDFSDSSSGTTESHSDVTVPESGEPVTSPLSADGEEVSLDDFMDTGFSSSVEEKKNDDIPDEEPINIDLSFAELPQENKNADFSTATSSEATAAPSQSPEPAESVSIESFDDMFDTKSEEKTDSPIDETASFPDTVEPDALANNISKLETESIALSDFGVDEDAEETPIKNNIEENKKPDVVDYDLAISDDASISAAPSINEIKSNIPESSLDRFEEETNSLLDKKTEKSDDTSLINNKILQQIVADLSGLKNEISELKSDFAKLKTREENKTSSFLQPDKKTGGGFFNENDEDDTISLSGAELDNIMNSADFTHDSPVEKPAPPDKSNEEVSTLTEKSIPVKEPIPTDITDTNNLFGNIDTSVDIPDTAVDEDSSSSLKMNFDDDNLEEPNLEDLNSDNEPETIPENLPEEISVSKVDDILVESSSSDFMDSIKETAPDEPSINTPLSVKDLPEISSSDKTVEVTKDITSTIDDVLKEEPSVSDSLTDTNIDYLETDANSAVLNQPEETVQPAVKEEQTIEKTPEIIDSSEADGIPSDLKQEIKSVLLYMDQLLENLPEDKIVEFAKSEQFSTYKKLFSDLGLS